jgi:hypothetical protein
MPLTNNHRTRSAAAEASTPDPDDFGAPTRASDAKEEFDNDYSSRKRLSEKEGLGRLDRRVDES